MTIREDAEWNKACENTARNGYFPLSTETTTELSQVLKPMAELIYMLQNDPKAITYEQVKEGGMSVDGNDGFKAKLFNLINNNLLTENMINYYLGKGRECYAKKDLQGLKDLQQALNEETFHSSAHYGITKVFGEYCKLLEDTVT